jgi:hypothetical protein
VRRRVATNKKSVLVRDWNDKPRINTGTKILLRPLPFPCFSLRTETQATKAELETATVRLKAKNLETLRSEHSDNLRHAIVKFIKGMARGCACPPVQLCLGAYLSWLCNDPMRLL